MKVCVVGVSQISDSYPNVRYKIKALRALYGDDLTEKVRTQAPIGFFAGLKRSGFLGRLIEACRFAFHHVSLLLSLVPKLSPIDVIYVVYPGVFLVLGFALVPRKYRPVIVLDGFISIYDAAVNDRRLLAPESLLSKALFWVEYKSFIVADSVLVDTEENREFYSNIFSIPIDRFKVIPLSIPPFDFKEPQSHSDRLNCLFIGTFVPLQGVAQIAKAARLLRDKKDIQITVVGSGQDASLFRSAVDGVELPNLRWIDSHLTTEKLLELLEQADVCLGIFGETPKAQRVLPFKIYYYLAAGKPVVTANTKCLRRLTGGMNEDSPFFLIEPAPEALASTLLECLESRANTELKANNARKYFDGLLSDDAIRNQLGSHIADVRNASLMASKRRIR